MLKEIERRNLERIEAFRDQKQKKDAFRPEKRKAGKKEKP